MCFYLGIDQHANQLTVSLRNGDGDVVLRKQVSTKPHKLVKFFEKLTARCAQNNCGFWAIVEVCGFNDWLIEMLRNFRCQRILLVQPETSGSGRRQKTDRRDAAKLSELLWMFRHRIEQNKVIDKIKIVNFPAANVRAQRSATPDGASQRCPSPANTQYQSDQEHPASSQPAAPSADQNLPNDRRTEVVP